MPASPATIRRSRSDDLVSLLDEVLVLTEKDLSKHCFTEKTWPAQGAGGAADRADPPQPVTTPGKRCRGVCFTIEVRNPRTQMAEVSIADSGVGIPPEQRLIFEPFYTTKTPDDQGHGGSGLDLSVCQQIIEQHQGRIRVESGRKGSKFTVKLPPADA